MTKLSVAIATFNEEKNIKDCLESVKEIADEIIIVDGSSTDQTAEIARSLGAKVHVKDNPKNFHINKQKAFDLTSGDWVLYLDADERLSEKLKKEVKEVINMDQDEINEHQKQLLNKKLFSRHQKVLEDRDGKIGDEREPYVAFFFPRRNYFLGKFLKYGGTYPDGVIRLFKKDKAYLPCKNVHEQMVVKGRVGWLQNDLLHIDSPTFKRYLQRNSRYIDLMADEFKRDGVRRNFINFINYCFLKPVAWFLLTQIRMKGILDGVQGIIFSFFSSLRFPRAYLRYLKNG